MKYKLSLDAACLAWIAGLALVVGCNPSGDAASDLGQDIPSSKSQAGVSEHEHGDEHADSKPADVHQALAKVESMKETICKAFSENRPEDAHHLLHDVGHVLEDLTPLALGPELNAEEAEVIKQCVESLFDGFAKFDDQLHGGEEVDVQQVEADLVQAISALKEAVQ
ncbi:MAG: hypothetical protein NXI32_29485 [bacterium]|nr:hypothetical protein [bacterium]